MKIRQFMKRKSICDSRSVKNISDKRLRMKVQPAQSNGVEKGKAFCERPSVLYCQQPEKDAQNFDLSSLRLPDILERQGLSFNLLLKLFMSFILEKHFAVHEYFPTSLKVLERLFNCSLISY